jgi:hypothetical protein
MSVATQRLSTFRASWVGNTVVQTRLCARRCAQQREGYGGLDRFGQGHRRQDRRETSGKPLTY